MDQLLIGDLNIKLNMDIHSLKQRNGRQEKNICKAKHDNLKYKITCMYY